MNQKHIDIIKGRTIAPETLTDEMVEDLKVQAENAGNDELAQECRWYLHGGASFSRTLTAEHRICDAINARSKS